MGRSQHCLNFSLCRKSKTISFKCLSVMKTCSVHLSFPIVIWHIQQTTGKIFLCSNPLLEATVSENLKITHKNFWRLWQTSCFFVLGGGKSWIHAQCREHSVNSVAADCYWIVQNIRWREYVIINKLFTGQSITNSDGAPGILL